LGELTVGGLSAGRYQVKLVFEDLVSCREEAAAKNGSQRVNGGGSKEATGFERVALKLAPFVKANPKGAAPRVRGRN